MDGSFPRTARSLARESPFGARLMLVSATLLLGGWGAWFRLARVPVYETSESARLEVQGATHPVDTSVAGRVVEVDVALDDVVAAGDVLLRLDDSAEQLQLDETRARVAGIAPQLDALQKQADADRAALAAFEQQIGAELTEGQSRLQEAAVVARAGEIEADRNQRLYAENLVSDADRLRARAEADRRNAAELTARASVEKQRREAATGAEDRRSRVLSLDREATSLAAQLSSLRAQIPTLEHAVERRTIRAPAAGRIGETANPRVGQVLAEAAHIATIVASGNLRVVALFTPAAIGRVRAGQRARVRLDAFPWTEYGALQATVTEVATELHEGKERIELAVDASSARRIPLQHGLEGKVDVAVEESTPVRLVVRAAGKPGT
jgi:multidrug resistance efflux pump